MIFVAPLLIGLPQRLSELHRNSFNAFSVILGLNCSAPGSISRANLVNRTMPVPDGVELDKVDASFKKGVLTVTLPKTAEAQKAEKKITVKAG
jgi:hypothetical protein